jgi:hypothetical protein
VTDLKFTGLKELQASYAKAAKAMAAGEARAVKRVSTTIVANQSRAIAGIVNLKIGTIKAAIETVKQPTASSPQVIFQVKGKGIPLGQFIGVRQTKSGVSVQVLKGGSRKVLRSAFISNKLGSSAKGFPVFGRAGKADKRRYGSPHVGRLPIIQLFGPDILSQYVKDIVQKAGSDTWSQRLPIELDRETTFALKTAGLL